MQPLIGRILQPLIHFENKQRSFIICGKQNTQNQLLTLEVRHTRCVGSITKDIVYYTYSQTQLYLRISA